MTIRFLPVLYCLVMILSFITCVREIDFKNDDADKTALVVNGGIYNRKGPFQLRLTRPTNYEKRDFEPVSGASVILSDDLGNLHSYAEPDPAGRPGTYVLEGIAGVPGRTYTLQITLSDGTEYRSRAQKMPEPLPVDSAEMRFAFIEDITAEGEITKVPFAFLYAHSTVPAQADGRYLRWEGEATFIFNELPGPNQKQCFVTNGISAQVVTLQDPVELQPGTHLEAYTGRRRIDYSFDLRNCFSLYQRTIGKEAYLYWKRVKSIVEPTGTVFDTPPAVIPGNLENLTDPGRPALGFFEVASSDTTRIYVNRGDLPFDVVAFIPIYCSTTNPSASKHDECLDCTRIGGSSLQKPDWWQ